MARSTIRTKRATSGKTTAAAAMSSDSPYINKNCTTIATGNMTIQGPGRNPVSAIPSKMTGREKMNSMSETSIARTTHKCVGNVLIRSCAPVRRQILVDAPMPVLNHHHGKIATDKKSR